jgi:hypothetical protein
MTHLHQHKYSARKRATYRIASGAGRRTFAEIKSEERAGLQGRCQRESTLDAEFEMLTEAGCGQPNRPRGAGHPSTGRPRPLG